MSIQRTWSRLVLAGFIICVPVIAAAQSTSSATIAGTARDATGAVLPGVSVEASSPALIEKTRSVVSDGQGNYKILDLRPGTYAVTFSLPGFATVKREGLELTTGFTANVSVEMRVGGVEETVTVTGASPVVDVQNVRTQQVLPRDVWDAIPTGKTLSSYVALTVGAVMGATGQDVGGTKGDKSGGGNGFEYHGSGQNDQAIVVDGMRVNQPTTGGGPWTRTTVNNDRAMEETTIGSGITAENENAGVVINLIPREGGNVFSGQFALNGSARRFQSDNLTPELIARNVPTPGTLKKLYDASGSVGGPIKRDRLWFFYSDRWWNAANVIPGGFFNATPKAAYGALPVYSPDISRPAVGAAPNHNDSLRVTWQINNAHKISSFVEAQAQCNCYFSASSSRAPEAALHLNSPYGSKFLIQENWTWVKGNRWLIKAGNSTYYSISRGAPALVGEASNTSIPLQDLNTGFFWNAPGDDPFPFGACCTPFPDGRIVGASWAHDQNYSGTYTTGSHTLKIGFRMYENGGGNSSQSYNNTPLGAVKVQVRGGVCLTAGCTPPPPVPATITLLPTPYGPASDATKGGNTVVQTALFAQDQLTIKRVTLNLGVRLDTMHGKYLAFTQAANQYVGEFSFPELDNAPNWKDVEPRIGAAYDLFGNGKTAVKASIGRFVVHQTSAGTSPSAALGWGQGARTWNDSFYPVGDPRRGNFFPDCDLKNPLSNAECGPLNNTNRGKPQTPTSFNDDRYLIGWHKRPYLWNTTTSVQHELLPGIGVTVLYAYTINGNQTASDNRAVSPSDYNSFCVTAPVDDRLGSVSGSRLCGLNDLNPSKQGQVNTLNTLARYLGVNPIDTFNGVDATVNARFGKGGVISGGVSTGKNLTDRCYTIDEPFRPGYCRNESPWMQGTQVKLLGNYPLPWWGIQVSATFQNLPTTGISANRTYSNAEILPSLGRNLASGATGTKSISMLPPNTLYEKRFSQTDIRFAKRIQVQRVRMQGQFDIYNAFNSSAILAESSTYGAGWQRPTTILGARLFKFGVQMDWK